MSELNFKRKGPEIGTSMVMFVHGYGADGADLLGIGDVLAPHMPGTVFVAPDAPERSAMNPAGFQWFPIPWIDGSSEEVSKEGMMSAVSDLQVFIKARLEEEGLSEDRLVLFGFSQGTMMSLHIAPRMSEAVAAVVGFSGRLLEPEHLADEVVSKPPVLLIHGDVDEVVPPESLPQAGEALTSAGFEVYAHVMKGTGHGIAQDGLSVALAFMREKLGLEDA